MKTIRADERLEHAKTYLSYGMRKGFIHEDYDLENMEDQEIIELADNLEAADSAYEAWKERDI